MSPDLLGNPQAGTEVPEDVTTGTLPVMPHFDEADNPYAERRYPELPWRDQDKDPDGVDHIGAALAHAQLEFDPIVKDRVAEVRSKTGTSYSYKYASLDQIIAKTRRGLMNNGLVVSQGTDVNPINGKSHVVTDLIHYPSGQKRRSWGCVLPDGEPRIVGGSYTYFRRYDLCAILGIVAEDDLDFGAMSRPARRADQGRRNSSDPASPPPDLTKEERDEFIRHLDGYKTLVGKEKLKKWVLNYSGAATIHAMNQSQWKGVLHILQEAAVRGDDYLLKLVNGD